MDSPWSTPPGGSIDAPAAMPSNGSAASASSPAQAAGGAATGESISAVKDPSTKVSAVQCPKSDAKKNCPKGQEKSCCDEESCMSLKDLNKVFKPAAVKVVCELGYYACCTKAAAAPAKKP